MKNYSAEQLNNMSREELVLALSESQTALSDAQKEATDLRNTNIDLHNANIDLTNKLLLTEEKLNKALRKIFGATSEHVAKEMDDPCEQLSFFTNEAEMWADTDKTETKTISVPSHVRTTGAKKENLMDVLPENTEVEVVEHYPDELKCPNCGSEMEKMGAEEKKTLVIIPAQIKIRKDVYYKYKCSNCTVDDENTVIVEAKREPSVLSGSHASPEAIAYIMTQKYVMASPLYRLEKELNRQHIMLSRQTMSHWFLEATERWLKPLYKELRKKLLKHGVLHADETTVQVLQEPSKKAQAKSYIWLYRTGADAKMPIVLYEYNDSRSAQNPKKFLEGFHGYLHADGYPGYHTLTDMTIVGCLAHARRKFYDALQDTAKTDTQKRSIAEETLRRIDEVFELERSYSELPFEERKQKREQELKPRLVSILFWLKNQNIPPKFALGKAVAYLENQWQYLMNVFKDGRLELTNNRAERSIKPFVIGRKNWLFANTVRGAQSSVIVYSIIETAKENGLDPYRYLLYIFREAPKLAALGNDWATKFLPSEVPIECKV